MASLGSQSIASSYEQLLHVDRDGGGNGTTLVSVKDGDNGTTFALQLASDKVQANGTLTVGTDDTGYDVTFYGDTASSNMTWDASADDLVLNDSTLKIDQDDDATSILIDSEAATATVVNVNGATTTTGKIINIDDADSLTSGSVIYVNSNSSSGSARSLVEIVNDHTSATDTACLKIQQDASAAAAPHILLTGEGGIKFDDIASANANTLDDYEEGTWTVAITGSTSGGFNMQSGEATGAYTKIGRVVHVQGGVTVASESSCVGNIQISLPVASGNYDGFSERSYGTAWLVNHGGTIGGKVDCVNNGSSSVFLLGNINDSGSNTYMTASEVDTSWFLGFSLTYIV